MTRQQAYQIVAAKIPTDDPTIVRRLDRAWSMIIGYGYEFIPHNAEYHTKYWTVEKLSTSITEDNGHKYTVDDIACTCPDYQSARGGLCKHRLAVMILTEMGEDI